MENRFSSWVKWQERYHLDGIEFPGVYAIALSDTNIASTAFSWIPEIIYVGMTNAKGGLTSRLQQFENTIKGKDGHGGAHRVRYKHPNYEHLASQLYVSIKYYKCNVESNKPIDLHIMGEVAKEKYECFALFVGKFNQLPEFNDKKRSPKKQGNQNKKVLMTDSV